MNWQEEYKRKLVSAEEAIKLVKSGDRVNISTHTLHGGLAGALADRRDELRNVETQIREPSVMPWFEPGWEESFSVVVENHVGISGGRAILDEKRGDYYPVLFSLWHKPFNDRYPDHSPIDVFTCTVSPPDKNGMCSFGSQLWNKRLLAREARVVLAEIDPTAIRTYGTNYIHVSEIDRFVENTPKVMTDEELGALTSSISDPEARSEFETLSARVEPELRFNYLPLLAALPAFQIRQWAQSAGYPSEPDEVVKAIGGYVSEIVQDGDTLQIGGGTPSTLMPGIGAFDEKHDLGIHSEMSARGLISLVERGVITGKRKNFHTGKAVLSALAASSMKEVQYAHNNPLIELYDTSYVVNISNVARNDNMVSINSALAIDLTGQVTAETVFGQRLIAGTGGQPELHMGAISARGGKAITCIRSTAMGGVVSRIVPQHEAGTAITVTRGFTDHVVTEYGIARLLGKTFRQRAEELIAVAHPDFRSDLRKEAQKLFYP